MWLGWFLHTTLTDSLRWPAPTRDLGFADRCGSSRRPCWPHWRSTAGTARGTGVATSTTAPPGVLLARRCRIDGIAQCWAVLSGAADPQRAVQAMEQADEQLVMRDEGIVRLFTPPFDTSEPDPGYIGPTHPARGRTAASTPTAPCGRSSPGRPSARGTGPPRSSSSQPGQPRPDPRGDARGTGSSPTSLQRMCSPSRRTSDAVAGPGTPAPRGGCTAPGWKPSSGSSVTPPIWSSSHACPRSGGRQASPTASATPPTTSPSRPTATHPARSARITLDGVDLSDVRLPLVDDGGRIRYTSK